MENALLVLCPDDPHWVPPDDKSLVRLLQSIQLISTPLDEPALYLAGDKFLDLVSFMGCSPEGDVTADWTTCVTSEGSDRTALKPVAPSSTAHCWLPIWYCNPLIAAATSEPLWNRWSACLAQIISKNG